MAPDPVDHDPLPGQIPDREGFERALDRVHSAIPDYESTIEDEIASP
jgi:hypothetical protein